MRELIEACPQTPYLLVDYTNLEISVEMTDEYTEQLRIYKPKVRGVFRYGLSEDMTGKLTTVAIRLGNKADANIFANEADARAALASAARSAG